MDDRARLRMYYLAGRVETPLPRMLCVNATLRCDGACAHCGIWKEKREGNEITPGDLERALARPFFQKVETAWITGGEPTLREDLPELARVMARSLPSLETIGIATNSLESARVLAAAGALREAAAPGGRKVFIQISLDGVGEVHDRVRRRKGAFAAAKTSIAGLKQMRDQEPGPSIEIVLNCVIQPENLDGLDDLAAFAREEGLLVTHNVAVVTDQVYRNRDAADKLGLGTEQKQKIISFLERISPSQPPALQYQYRIIRAVLEGKPRPNRCLTLYSTININADGTLIPCPATSDLFPKSALGEDLPKLWTGDEARAFRERVRREFCPGCMLSCSLGDSMPLSEWLKGGWDARR